MSGSNIDRRSLDQCIGHEIVDNSIGWNFGETEQQSRGYDALNIIAHLLVDIRDRLPSADPDFQIKMDPAHTPTVSEVAAAHDMDDCSPPGSEGGEKVEYALSLLAGVVRAEGCMDPQLEGAVGRARLQLRGLLRQIADARAVKRYLEAQRCEPS